MVFDYKSKEINNDDRILRGDKDCRNQIIDEQFIHYAVAISTDDDFPEESLTSQEIIKIVETLIIADIGDIVGYEYWKKYGINAWEEGDGKIIWKYV